MPTQLDLWQRLFQFVLFAQCKIGVIQDTSGVGAPNVSEQARVLSRCINEISTGNDGLSRMPTELSSMIIAEIDDATTYRTCRLVSRSWAQLLLPRTFESIVLKPNPKHEKSIDDFYAFLADRGNIGCCIRRLHIYNLEEADPIISNVGSSQRHEDHDGVLFRLLGCLPNLRHLRIPATLCLRGVLKLESTVASTTTTQQFRLRSLYIELGSLHGAQASKAALSSSLARLLSLFGSVDTLRLSRTGQNISGRGIQGHIASGNTHRVLSTTRSVDCLHLVDSVSMMLDPRVHLDWLGQLRYLSIDGSRSMRLLKAEITEALVEALRSMHKLKVFDISMLSVRHQSTSSHYLEATANRFLPALAACTELQTIRLGVCLEVTRSNTMTCSTLMRTIFHPLTHGILSNPLESVELIIKGAIPQRRSRGCHLRRPGSLPHGTGLQNISVQQRKENITDGAIPMWQAAAQAIEAGKVQKVQFMMRKSKWCDSYVKHYEDRMREVMPDLLADGKFVVS